VIPNFTPVGSVLNRKYGLATFIHEQLERTLVDQSPVQSETEWLCVDFAGYKIINVYKPPHPRSHLQPSRRSHGTVCMMAISTASMSAGVLAGIQPAELRRSGATLYLGRRAMEPGHLLHSALTRPTSAVARRLKSRHPFVLSAQ